MGSEDILAAIAALTEQDRQTLFARLRERYGLSAPRPTQLALNVSGFEGPPDFLIVFDGGSLGNPGAGYGSYAVFEAGKPGFPSIPGTPVPDHDGQAGRGDKTRLSFEGQMTNNEAEYRSLIAALNALLDRLEAAGRAPSAATLEIRADSALVLNQVRGDWKAKEPRLRELRDDVRALLNRFQATRLVSQPREDTVKVLGH